jgi:hypothetical protein
MGLLSTEQSDNFFETNSAAEAVQKSPTYFVLPSDSEASLTSFGTGSPGGRPLASLGATKK